MLLQIFHKGISCLQLKAKKAKSVPHRALDMCVVKAERSMFEGKPSVAIEVSCRSSSDSKT